MEQPPEITKDQTVGLKKLREEFPDSLIGKLPKPSKTQTDIVKEDYRKGIRCKVCGGWHHKDVVHLDYVGHAAATDRMLDADPLWTWEPLTVDENSLPKFDNIGGLWIKLTICGVTRLGYGHPDGKKGGNAIKETIGDAIRNAGMRFGVALDLWCKEGLHQDEGDSTPLEPEKQKKELADFTDQADKHDSLSSLNKWVLEVTADVESNLNQTDQGKFGVYIVQLRATHKPKTVTCPMSKKESLLVDCQIGDCFNTCDVAREALI